MLKKFLRFIRIRDPRWPAALVGAALFIMLAGLAEGMLLMQTRESDARTQARLAAEAANLRAHLERELSAMLYLSSGLSSYLVVHRDELEGATIHDMLAVLYRGSRFVRNFGIAVGYRLTYIYPKKGNEKAIGIDYRELPEQWTSVRRSIEEGIPVLSGPVNLVEGGQGLIYRLPVKVNGRYWGMLSTVIETKRFLDSVFRELPKGVEVAMRGKDGRGSDGQVFWGDAAIFASRRAVVLPIEIPGGSWQLAIDSIEHTTQASSRWQVRAGVLLLSALMAWGAYLLVLQRRQLAQLALYDTLTRLPNRRLLEDRLESALSRQARHRESVCAVLFVDLDGFKAVNDSFGHKAGDTVLKTVARRARTVVRGGDTVARLGGDEMVLVLENTRRQEIGAIVQRLETSIREPIVFEKQSINVGASIGIALSPDDGQDAVDLIRIADERMYRLKHERRAAGDPSG